MGDEEQKCIGNLLDIQIGTYVYQKKIGIMLLAARVQNKGCYEK